MFYKSTNASNFLNYIYLDYIFLQKNDKEIKERAFQFAYSYINKLNKILFGIDFINKINKYFVFKNENLIKINEVFFIDNKEEFINLLNPNWYNKNINKKNNDNKEIINLFIFNEIMKFELPKFFISIFLSNDILKTLEKDRFTNSFDIGYVKNNFRLPSIYFSKNQLKLNRNSISLLKHIKINEIEFKNYKDELLKFLEQMLLISYDINYNKQRTKLTSDIEEELILNKIIFKKELFYDQNISLTNSLNFRLNIDPRKFITYDFKNKKLIELKNELIQIINIINYLKFNIYLS